MAWFRGSTETRNLTDPAYSVERGSPLSRALPFLIALVIIVALGVGALKVFQAQFAPALRVTELEAENARLGELLTGARMQAELDAATRSELERQLAELSAEVNRLSQELIFYKRAKSPKP